MSSRHLCDYGRIQDWVWEGPSRAPKAQE